MDAPLWNYRNEEHRDVFAGLLSPLIVASRSRDFVDRGRAKDQLIAWVMSMHDVPLPLLEAGVARLMARGVNWMPRPGDLRDACCDIRDEARRAAAVIARVLQEKCEDCSGTGLKMVQENPYTVTKCECRATALAIVEAAGMSLPRPALPPAQDSDVA